MNLKLPANVVCQLQVVYQIFIHLPNLDYILQRWTIITVSARGKIQLINL